MGENRQKRSRPVVLLIFLMSLVFLLLFSGCSGKPVAKPGCDVSGEYLDCDKWSVCQDGTRTRLCRDLLGCLETSSFTVSQSCEISVKTGELKTGPMIAEFCNNDDVCDKGENFHLCPNDCSPNAIDNLCNDKKNNICDPDCGARDIDCLPVATKFTEDMTTNLSGIKDLRDVKDLELGIKGVGKIEFKKKVDILGLNLDEEVDIGQNQAAYSGLLNSSARLTLYGIDLQKPAVLFDDRLCKNCRIRSYRNRTLVFDVHGPGVYSAKETADLTATEKEKAEVQEEGPKFYKTRKFTIALIIILAVLIVFGAFYAFFKNITLHVKLPHHEHREKRTPPPEPLMEIKPYLPEKEEKKRKGKKGKKGKGKKEKEGSRSKRRIVKAKPRSTKIVKRPPKNRHRIIEIKPRKKKKKGKSSKTLMRIRYNPKKAKKLFKEGMTVVKQKDKEYEKKMKEKAKKQKGQEKARSKKGRKSTGRTKKTSRKKTKGKTKSRKRKAGKKKRTPKGNKAKKKKSGSKRKAGKKRISRKRKTRKKSKKK